MMKSNVLLIALGVSVVAACDNDPVKDAPRAEAQAPVEKKEAPQESAAQKKTLAINSDNATLKFVGAKVTATHPGEFKKLDGTLELVDQDPTKSSVSITIDMSSLSIEPEKLDGHLRSGDFFDVEKFPVAKFESTSITKKDDGYQVTGNLTLHGVTKSVSFPAKIAVDETSVLVDAKFGINRKDFDIVYPGMPDDLIKDEVLIDIKLEPKVS